ncbi:methylmalonyl-CoA mutase family protein [Brevundimonas aveniformis]|uniref:methylmalonyl-CoA mutase family protein n=1 Tax=Brevundimonas aveniformis TaxID=370977 RepID=UPI002492DE33|nr:methylmalonyl-CoA mutase family protein [Brevundimonas aveniformis]
MSSKPLSLTEGFAAPDLAAWEKAASKTAPDARFDALIRRSLDGIEIGPLYGAWNAGAAPSARKGVAADPTRPWDLRNAVFAHDPGEANRASLTALAQGAASILLPVEAAGIGSADDMAAALDGVLLELATVALDAGARAVEAANWLAVVAKGSPQAKLAFHLDPVSLMAREGPDLFDSAVQTAMRHEGAYPNVELFLGSGRFVHEAGGTEAQELAVMLASAVAYARALEAAGMSSEAALSRVTLGLTVDNMMFISLAKTRAARALWAQVCAASGVSVPARIEARSSRRMLSAADPWTNLLRLTAAGFGAGAGGADAVVLDPFDVTAETPTPLALRQARNIQLILMEEAHLGRVADPAGGSWFVESLTRDLAGAAWAEFQKIEAGGGVLASLNRLADEVSGARSERDRQLKDGERQMIGVTVHRPADAAVVVSEAAMGRFAPVSLTAAFEGAS